MARVVKGARSSTRAPAAARACAAASTAAATAGSTASPQPASRSTPMRRPCTPRSMACQSTACGGRPVASRCSGSGRDSASIISAASATSRVSGPATRPG